jgi:hypothetical protein|tara:strand:- start:105 stop:917 length:813 start_codon:yes stop_codon:yes gene_type:complete
MQEEYNISKFGINLVLIMSILSSVLFYFNWFIRDFVFYSLFNVSSSVSEFIIWAINLVFIILIFLFLIKYIRINEGNTSNENYFSNRIKLIISATFVLISIYFFLFPYLIYFLPYSILRFVKILIILFIVYFLWKQFHRNTLNNENLTTKTKSTNNKNLTKEIQPGFKDHLKWVIILSTIFLIVYIPLGAFCEHKGLGCLPFLPVYFILLGMFIVITVFVLIDLFNLIKLIKNQGYGVLKEKIFLLISYSLLLLIAFSTYFFRGLLFRIF